MNKAILVIDIPNKCSECPCFYDYLHCQANEDANVLGDERPNNCPLKPLPQKKGIKGDIYNHYLLDIDKGYNACIDEILGGNE